LLLLARKALVFVEHKCRLGSGFPNSTPAVISATASIFSRMSRADEVRPLDHSKHPNRLSLNLRPQQRMQPFARGEIRRAADDL
jgi:hypothetical protein